MKITKAENGVDIEFMNENSNLDFRGPPQDGRLDLGESGGILGPDPPARVRVAAPGADAGARRVDEHTVEGALAPLAWCGSAPVSASREV